MILNALTLPGLLEPAAESEPMVAAPCISLWQPWASLLALGEKVFETRHWGTNVRGPVAIHAAKNRSGLEMLATNGSACLAIQRALARHGVDRHNISLGGIVGIGNLSRSQVVPDSWNWNDYGGTSMPDRILQGVMPFERWSQEMLFGDWSPGRVVWRFERPVSIAPMIACIGRQGFWTARVPRRYYEQVRL